MEEGGRSGRITEREYVDRLTAIYARLAEEVAAGAPDSDAGRRAREAELTATIDWRLGIEFPNNRRAAVLAVMDEIEAARERLGEAISAGRVAPSDAAAKVQDLAAELRARLSVVLSPAELTEFLGEGELPLPPSE